MALPIPPASLTALDAAKGFVYYSTQPVQGLSGPLPGEDPVLHAFDLTERKDKTVIKGISRWWLSHDGSKILYEAKSGGGPGAYGIIDAKPDAGAEDRRRRAESLRAAPGRRSARRVAADLQRGLAAGA